MTTSKEDWLDQAIHLERGGKLNEARDALRKAIAREEEADRAIDARLLLGKLLVHGRKDDEKEAETVLEKARDLAREEGAQVEESEALHLWALLERRRGNPEKARQLLSESPVGSEASNPNPSKARWFHYQGLLDSDRGDLTSAERLFYRAYQIYRECHHEPGISEVCDSLANLLLNRGKTRAALIFAKKGLEVKRKWRDRQGEAIALGTLGRVYRLQAKNDEARAAFEQDLAIARELGDDRGVAIMLNSLAEIALTQRDADRAIALHQESLDTDPGPVNVGHARIGLTRAYLVKGSLGEAEQVLELMERAIFQNGSHMDMRDFSLGLRGAVAWRRGDYDEGKLKLDEAIGSLEKADRMIDAIDLLYELRDLHQSRGETAKSVTAMGRALDLLCECGAEHGVEEVERWLRTVDAPGLTRLALERHFPSWLVEDVLSGKMNRPSPKRQVITVLFSDIRDYTPMTAGLTPEEVVELLNEWFTEATRAIRRHGGVVDKFIGDAVMALFGVPESHEDEDAAAAIRAALDMREALSAMNLRHEALRLRTIRIGVGIDRGEAVVGFIGSHLRHSFTAIGDVVNTAARLEAATKDHACDILISESVERAQRLFKVAETRFVGRLDLKGITHGVPAYHVLGPLESRVKSR